MPRVLLIEDDRAVREGVALALRRQGHDVAAAETGEEGLERLRSFRPDVVVLDLMLPGMPGLDVCRAMRADTRLAVDGSDELADLSHTFNETAAALEESVAELRGMEARARRFAADVSHELRTPLAAMAAVTDVLDEDAARLDPDTATAVRLISEETVKLARLVDDLMEISRFDAGAAVLHLDEIDLAESLRRTLADRAWAGLVDAELPRPDAVRGRVEPLARPDSQGVPVERGPCRPERVHLCRSMPGPAHHRGRLAAACRCRERRPRLPRVRLHQAARLLPGVRQGVR